MKINENQSPLIPKLPMTHAASAKFQEQTEKQNQASTRDPPPPVVSVDFSFAN
jgi:hypothetical protein